MKGLATMMLVIALAYGQTTGTVDLENTDPVEAAPSEDAATDDGPTDVSLISGHYT